LNHEDNSDTIIQQIIDSNKLKNNKTQENQIITNNSSIFAPKTSILQNQTQQQQVSTQVITECIPELEVIETNSKKNSDDGKKNQIVDESVKKNNVVDGVVDGNKSVVFCG
jgi:hypothetical protein